MNAPTTLCRPHRFTDPVTPINSDVHDASRLLVAAVETLDRLGIPVITVQADRRRNQRVMVEHCPACEQLGGVAMVSNPEYTLWSANRYGIEIRWMKPTRGMAS